MHFPTDATQVLGISKLLVALESNIGKPHNLHAFNLNHMVTLRSSV